MSRVSLEWFSGIPEHRKEDFSDLLKRSPIILKQLLALCDKWEDELNAQESKITDYDTPSWEAKQAHRNGDRSRIRKLRDLLSFLKE